jgi:hypothetical protein
MNNNDKNIDALDLLAVLLAYLSLHNYEENDKQNKKLDTIIYDIEQKLEYQNNLLREILKKIEGEKDGN